MYVSIVYTQSGAIQNITAGPVRDWLEVDPHPFQRLTGLSSDFQDVSMETHFVQGGQLSQKQPFSLQLDKLQIVADGNDLATISNIPAGTTLVWHDGQVDEINDGIAQLDTDLPGTYTLKFSAIPYLDQEVVIEAVAPA